MKQVFILGASSVCGIGAEYAGWGDLIKQHFYSMMFSDGGIGEVFEVYNFAKSGATIDFIINTFPQHFENYSKGNKAITIVSVGGNDSRAKDESTNYASTPESYTEKLIELIRILKEKSENIIFVTTAYVDESRTNPFVSPNGHTYYFTNSRRKQFEDITKQLCKQNNIDFVSIHTTEEEWAQKYAYQDGLHPNQTGHQLVFEAIKPCLASLGSK